MGKSKSKKRHKTWDKQFEKIIQSVISEYNTPKTNNK